MRRFQLAAGVLAVLVLLAACGGGAAPRPPIPTGRSRCAGAAGAAAVPADVRTTIDRPAVLAELASVELREPGGHRRRSRPAVRLGRRPGRGDLSPHRPRARRAAMGVGGRRDVDPLRRRRRGPGRPRDRSGLLVERRGDRRRRRSRRGQRAPSSVACRRSGTRARVGRRSGHGQGGRRQDPTLRRPRRRPGRSPRRRSSRAASSRPSRSRRPWAASGPAPRSPSTRTARADRARGSTRRASSGAGCRSRSRAPMPTTPRAGTASPMRSSTGSARRRTSPVRAWTARSASTAARSACC